jgi:hypothetical protein
MGLDGGPGGWLATATYAAGAGPQELNPNRA